MRCSRTGFVVVAVMLATTAAGCGSDDSGAASAATGSTPATTTFAPHLTYEVPAGWSNLEDLPGNFLLLPPGSTLAGVNPETSDFLGVYSSVGAPVQCTDSEAADPSVASTPQAMVDWLHTQPAIQVSTATEVTIGGLSGLQVDLSLDAAHVDVACHDDLGAFALAFVGTGDPRSRTALAPTTHCAWRSWLTATRCWPLSWPTLPTAAVTSPTGGTAPPRSSTR